MRGNAVPAGRSNRRKTRASPLARPLIGLVAVYRYTISPLLGMSCRFEPSCSEYAREALERYGAVKGSWLAARRLARCQPWGGSGYDPLPEDRDRQ